MKKNSSAVKWILNVTGKGKVYVLFLLLVQSLQGLTAVYHALCLRNVVNAAVMHDKSLFNKYIFLFGLLLLFQVILTAVRKYYEDFSKASLENIFKDRCFSYLLAGDYSYVTSVHSAEWMNRLTSDTVVVANGITEILPGLAGMIVKLVGAIAAIVILEPRFLYFLIPSAMLLPIPATIFRKIMKSLHKKIQEEDGKLRTFLTDRLASLLIVKTFSQEENTVDQEKDYLDMHLKARMKRSNFSNAAHFGFSFFMNGIYLVGAIYCGSGILTGSMSYGNFTAVLQLIGQVQNPFANITGYLPKYYSMLASAERLMEIEDYSESKEVHLTASECQDIYNNSFKSIELQNVSFSYIKEKKTNIDEQKLDNDIVLNSLNISVKKGDFTAIIGPSGCGKSTLLKVLMSVYPVDEGKRIIHFNDSISEMSSRYLPMFSYVPQGNHLFSGKLRDVLTFSNNDISDEEIYEALKVSCSYDFVNELEGKLDTVVGERGFGLSEGQIQRLAIARAIISKHPIMLLDEATSSLDEATEKQLLSNLKELNEFTIVTVTHRKAVLDFADIVIDLEKK